MQQYLNLSGNSGVTHYEIGADYILVKFCGDDPPYRYSYARAGKRHVDRMKALAVAGRIAGYLHHSERP
jgi:hypothetical protein